MYIHTYIYIYSKPPTSYWFTPSHGDYAVAPWEMAQSKAVQPSASRRHTSQSWASKTAPAQPSDVNVGL